MKTREIILELEEVMFKNDMTQEQLAKKLRVSFQTVNRWFNEHTEPNRRNWYKIKKYLNSYNSAKTIINAMSSLKEVCRDKNYDR